MDSRAFGNIRRQLSLWSRRWVGTRVPLGPNGGGFPLREISLSPFQGSPVHLTFGSSLQRPTRHDAGKLGGDPGDPGKEVVQLWDHGRPLISGGRTPIFGAGTQGLTPGRKYFLSFTLSLGSPPKK